MNALFVICGIGVFSLLAEVFNLKKWVRAASYAGLILAVGLLIKDWGIVSYYYRGMLFYDRFSVAFTCLVLIISIFWCWMSGDFLKNEAHRSDKSALVFFVIAGALMMVAFNNMAVLFLGIEILSISLYVLAGSDKENLFSTEAAFKYFLMGSFATGFLLFGMTLVYGATGSFNIPVIADFITQQPTLPRFLYIGVLMMMAGLAFKISAVPFHTWAPDVYEGSPTAITTLMATVVKVGAFAAFIKIFSVCFQRFHDSIVLFEQGIMVLTLVIANITAVYQANVKRMLAYSSVGHVGYLLLAFSSANAESSGAIFYYLIAYTAATIMAFAVVQVVEANRGSANIANFNGLVKSNPLVAIAMTVAMLSLAGIPPLAGFFGKYLVFTLSVSKGFVALTVVAVITSLISVYYYFKPLVAMYQAGGQPISITQSQKWLFIFLILFNLLAGLAPDLFSLF